jgi:hypothetical protein
MSQPLEYSPFHDSFERWTKHSCGYVTWHDFFPPSCVHELDFMINYDILHALTHAIFVPDLSLLWFMIKHRGRCYDTMLEWFHWLHDYT